MIGVIYKFTIKTTKVFYVGQHECNSIEEFLKCKPTGCYWGNGTVWYKHILSLKSKFPNSWYKLIKREVLCFVRMKDENSNMKLNKLEKYWIERTNAHYSKKVGGCNILKGAAYGDDWINSMKLPEVRKKAGDSNKISLMGKMKGEKHWNYGKHRSEETKRKISIARKGVKLSEETRKKLSEISRGRKFTEEHKRKISESQKGERGYWYGKKQSKESCEKLSKSLKNFYKNNECVIKGCKWITNGIIDKWLRKGESLPDGWRYGRVNH